LSPYAKTFDPAVFGVSAAIVIFYVAGYLVELDQSDAKKEQA